MDMRKLHPDLQNFATDGTRERFCPPPDPVFGGGYD